MMGSLDRAYVHIGQDPCTGDPNHAYFGAIYISLYADDSVQLHVQANAVSPAGGLWHPIIMPNVDRGNILAELSILGEGVDLTKLMPGNTRARVANLTLQMIPVLDYDSRMKALYEVE